MHVKYVIITINIESGRVLNSSDRIRGHTLVRSPIRGCDAADVDVAYDVVVYGHILTNNVPAIKNCQNSETKAAAAAVTNT